MKAYIRYSRQFLSGPVTPWMRDDPAGKTPRGSGSLPEPGPTLRGWRRYYVRIDGFEFRFASLSELDHCARVLSQKNLPPAFPNGHWLSRLPGWVKTWRYRQKAVKGLRAALVRFLAEGDEPEKIQDPFDEQLERRQREAATRTIAQKIEKKRRLRATYEQIPSAPKGRRLKRLLAD